MSRRYKLRHVTGRLESGQNQYSPSSSHHHEDGRSRKKQWFWAGSVTGLRLITYPCSVATRCYTDTSPASFYPTFRYLPQMISNTQLLVLNSIRVTHSNSASRSNQTALRSDLSEIIRFHFIPPFMPLLEEILIRFCQPSIHAVPALAHRLE